MKSIIVTCPGCGNTMTYKNYWSWVWKNPFHWFSRRKVKCSRCGRVFYGKGMRLTIHDDYIRRNEIKWED